MHTKQTTKYICEEYTSGNKYYYKQEFLMEQERWGSKRPVSKQTYLKRKNDGYKCLYHRIRKTPALIIQFPIMIHAQKRFAL